MNQAKLYYTAPANECFDELKNKATEIWNGYDDPYRTEKLDRIKDIKNVQDNFMYLVAMFDIHNQRKLADRLSEFVKKEVRDRMLDGGASPIELIGWY